MSLVDDLKKQIQELEESEYKNTERIKIVPPHYVLINPDSQEQYEDIMRKNRQLEVLNKGFLTVPGDAVIKQGDNLLEVVNEQVFQKPWDKLDLEYQVNRLFMYLDKLQEECNLTNTKVVKLRKQFLDYTFRHELKAHQVEYDCQQGKIIDIKGINNKYELEIIPITRKITIIDEIVSEKDNKIICKPLKITVKRKIIVVRKKK